MHTLARYLEAIHDMNASGQFAENNTEASNPSFLPMWAFLTAPLIKRFIPPQKARSIGWLAACAFAAQFFYWYPWLYLAPWISRLSTRRVSGQDAFAELFSLQHIKLTSFIASVAFLLIFYPKSQRQYNSRSTMIVSLFLLLIALSPWVLTLNLFLRLR